MHITELFKTKQSNLLNIYCTAGYPRLDSLKEILPALAASGVDMVEIGIPYSDPIADGLTIQHSNLQALDNGISLEKIFQQLREIPVEIPRIFMGYFNSVFQYGIERFCQDCVEAGVSGLILPDLPVEIYAEQYQSIIEQAGISMIFLVSPDSSEARIRMIDSYSSSFIYAVSSSSTTGNSSKIQDVGHYLQRLSNMGLDHPIMLGFNIRNKEDVAFAQQHCSGAIIGSAFIRSIADSCNLKEQVGVFIQDLN